MTKDTTLLVATVKNEGPYILEWVAHHRLCGFDRIQVYQNDSTDMTVQMLRTLDRIGAIEFRNNRYDDGNYRKRAYQRTSRSDAYRNSTWCLALDGDEFLNVNVGNRTVNALIEASPSDATAVAINWRLFGSADQHEMSNQLVTERFTRAQSASAIRSKRLTPFKTLFRTEAYGKPDTHFPRARKIDRGIICNASGLRQGEFTMKKSRSLDPGGRKFAQINHYMLRDLQSFLLKRFLDNEVESGRDTDLSYWNEHNRNEEEDRSLAMRAFEIRAEMKRLDEASDGKLMQLRRRSLRKSRAILDGLLKNEDIRALRDEIVAIAPMQQPFRLPGNGDAVFKSVRTSERQAPLLLRRVAGR